MEISFISLLAMSSVLATCFFVIRHALIKYLIILFVIFKIMDFLILLLAFGMIISSLFVYKYVAVRYKDITCGFSVVYLQCRFIMYFPCRESCSCLCWGPINWFPLHICYSLILPSNLLYNYEIMLNNLLYRLGVESAFLPLLPFSFVP
jgi:hypothetical protein